ncbi:MAG: 3'-5' exonuclease [Planctomycetaceae bacterium]|nr:3'-5' exonuclease [Planctomycetaceae bacterium]
MTDSPAYLVFDIESVADAQLISKVHFAGKVPPENAIREYRDELLKRTNGDSDFIPYTFQIPVSVVIGKVSDKYELLDIVAIDEPQYRSHEICAKFWRGWKKYKQPTLVSFNGRGFDIPMLELAAFRYGIPIPDWFAANSKTFEQPRNRFNMKSHIDLFDILTNFGAARFNGGLNLAANLLGKPGKMNMQGFMVQDIYDGNPDDRSEALKQINDYCRCDVLDTYFVFLRTMMLTGNLPLGEEHNLVQKTKDWISSQTEKFPVYSQYLEHWGDWQNPWKTPEEF